MSDSPASPLSILDLRRGAGGPPRTTIDPAELLAGDGLRRPGESASLLVSRTYKWDLPDWWEREISADELVSALVAGGHVSREGGAGGFGLRLSPISVIGQIVPRDLRPHSEIALRLTAHADGWTAEQVDEISECLDQACAQLATVTAADAFAHAPRSPGDGEGHLLFARLHKAPHYAVVTERVEMELPQSLFDDLAGEGEARAAIHLADPRCQRPETLSRLAVSLRGRRVSVTGNLYCEPVDALREMLKARGLSISSQPSSVPSAAPSTDNLLRWTAAALTVGTLATWAVPAGWWWVVALIYAIASSAVLLTWRARRPLRHRGGWALAAVLGLVLFACLYKLVGGSAFDDGDSSQFGDYVLMAIGMSTGGALFDVHLVDEAPRLLAHAQLLWTITVLAGAVQSAVKHTAAWVLDRFGHLVPDKPDEPNQR